MKKQLFTDGISYIDVDAVERLLQIEQDLQRRKIRQRRTRLLIIPAAALLALLVCMTAVIIPFIPKTLELDYQPSKGMPERVWVYYVNENGKQKRELVKQPQGAQNVFTSWKHLNTVDNEVQLLDYTVTTEPTSSTTVVPDTLWESLLQMLDKTGEQTIVTAKISAGITSYENCDALIESLIDTLAKYAGVAPEQVKILIDGEQVGIVGTLQFYHSLQDGSAIVVATGGSTLEITVGMTNISDEIIHYTGSSSAFVPDATLRMGNTVIEHEIRPFTEDEAHLTLAPGESREITYTFPIPENAARGEYDLLVTFDGQDFVFEKAVHVIGEYLAPTDVAAEFQEFMLKYGFCTTDPTQFREAVEQLSFTGMNLFDIMTAARFDYAEGYSGEEHGSQWFAYGYKTLPNGNSNNYFVAKKIPDDMRLPCGITFADTLYHSLCKMGLTDFEAEEIIARLEIGDEQQIYLGNNGLYLTRDQEGNYIMRYSTLTVLSSSNYPAYSLDIIYSHAEMIAQLFLVKAGVGNFSTDAFTAPITVAPLTYENPDRELDDADAQTLIDIFYGYGGTWNNGGVDVEFDYRITSNGMVFSYSTRAGVLADSGGYIALSNEHRLIVNEIVTKGNYQPNFENISFIEAPDGSTRQYYLPMSVALQITHALNSAEWHDGSVELEPLLWFDCDGKRVGYDNGLFFTTQHYWYADNYTEDCINALQDAVIGMRTKEYDAIIYYAGTYYGHSAAVDEKLNGTMDFSMNIAPQPLEDILFAYNDKQAVDALGFIVDCKNAVDKGVLLTDNGAYFERIVEIKPNFGNGEVKLIRTPAGEPPIGALTEEDAQTLREIFQRAEFTYSFGDHDAVYETTLEIGGYTIAYLSAWGDAKIGNLKATLSEQDTQTVAEILGGYINVE